MIREDVVEYLRTHLSGFAVDDLRKQLLAEGVSAEDLEDSMTEALRRNKGGKAPTPARRLVLMAAAAAVVGAAALAFTLKKPAPTGGEQTSASGESGFVGARGWVVRLPKDYVGVSDFKDSARTQQVVYFCKKDTDHTNFLNEGLYGQLGIVKLEVVPSEFPNNATGLANLARLASQKYDRAGEKYVMKNIQVGTLSGVQVLVQSPFPRVEAFVLGEQDLYFFYAGMEDEIWRDIVLSLRDAHTEG